MKRRDREPIPAFLSIDVEPDTFQMSAEEQYWPGYAATYEFARSLRRELARASGMKPVFGWYFRTDPQIEQVCGRADVAMAAFAERTAALREEGDYFGVHSHPIRWSGEHGAWVHDFRDRQWLRDSTQFALNAFARCNGSPARRFRAGAGFLSNDIVDVLDRNGVAVELGLEPVAGWGLRSTFVPSGIDKSPMVGEYTNCVTAPKTPYYPSCEDFRSPGGSDARRILMIPVSTGPNVLPPKGLVARLKRCWRGNDEPEALHVLNPTEDETERDFWNLVSHRLRSMERPYLSLGIRTDRLESRRARRVCRLFTELTRHPIAKQLRFVDPLGAMERIAPDRTAQEAPRPKSAPIPRAVFTGRARPAPRRALSAIVGDRSTAR